jgi:hypothetical protein
VNTPVRVVVGDPISRAELDPFAKDAKGMMAFLREKTYALSPEPLDTSMRGFEFEERHRDEHTDQRRVRGRLKDRY